MTSRAVAWHDAENGSYDADLFVWRELADAGGSKQTGLNWLHLPAGRMDGPPHCHSEEEEVFVVLEGEGTLELWPSPVAVVSGDGPALIGPNSVTTRSGSSSEQASKCLRTSACRRGEGVAAGVDDVTGVTISFAVYSPSE